MSDEQQPNWFLAGVVFALMTGAIGALAFPALRVFGILILVAYWAAVAAGLQYSTIGARKSDTWIRLALASVVVVIGAIALPPSERIFLVFFSVVEIGIAGWWYRKASRK